MKKILLWASCAIFTLNSTAMAQRKTKVACVGNSVTYGLGIEEREKYNYPTQLQAMLGKDYEVANFGKSGATLLSKGHRPYIKEPEYASAVKFAGDIVVIHLGLNDTDPRNWLEYRDEFVKDYITLIDTFRKANPKARFIIARMTPIFDRHPRFDASTRDWHAQIQLAIEQVAQYTGAQLMDFHAPLYHRPETFPDALHPNADGAKILAETVYGNITGNWGGLQLPAIYSDNMVIQRNAPFVLKGRANAGKTIKVSVNKEKAQTVSRTDGYWSVTLPALSVGKDYTVNITDGSKEITYKNVVAGEVWLCSGQSNMEFMVKQTSTPQEDLPTQSNPYIRLYDMKANWRTDNIEWGISALDSINQLQHYTPTQWTIATDKTVSDFSAVAYYFGKMLQDSLQVPIGLICNAVGGSPTEAWIDRNTLEYQFPLLLKDWRTNSYAHPWVKERANKNVAKAKIPLQRHPYEPCYLYETGIEPLKNFTIKGVIWYQGESNAHNAELHEKVFPLLVESWRKTWNNAELPFYFVQLSSLNRLSWTHFRDVQRKLSARIPHVGMAVSSDVGDLTDVHPQNKRPVGIRLARLALNQTYGWKSISAHCPYFPTAVAKGKQIHLSFDTKGSMKTADNQAVRTFEVAEIDGLYYPATAQISGNTVIILLPKEIKQARLLRYGWQPFTTANLTDSEGLPMSTFQMAIP